MCRRSSSNGARERTPERELVEDAVIGYFDELARTREMLDRRFDDLDAAG